MCVSALVAHLLFQVANADLHLQPTALPDTFGTPAFLAVATAADIPEQFVRDMRQELGLGVSSSGASSEPSAGGGTDAAGMWGGLGFHPGWKCFSLFRCVAAHGRSMWP